MFVCCFCFNDIATVDSSAYHSQEYDYSARYCRGGGRCVVAPGALAAGRWWWLRAVWAGRGTTIPLRADEDDENDHDVRMMMRAYHD